MKKFRTYNLSLLALFEMRGICFTLETLDKNQFFGEAPETTELLKALDDYKRNCPVPIKDYSVSLRAVRFNLVRAKRKGTDV